MLLNVYSHARSLELLALQVEEINLSRTNVSNCIYAMLCGEIKKWHMT